MIGRHGSASIRRASCLPAVLLVCFGVRAYADVTLPALFGDHMVVQRNARIRVWGTAERGEPVSVALSHRRGRAVADEEGRWSVSLGPLEPGGPHELVVAGSRSMTIVHDVLVGEVWLASGQSNMRWPVIRSKDAEREIAGSGHPDIRFFRLPESVAVEAQSDADARWVLVSPGTVPHVSAIAYFFAREIHESHSVPVGILQAAVGNTPAEAWTSLETLGSDPELRPILERWERILAAYPEEIRAYQERKRAWERAAAQADAAGEPRPPEPVAPRGPDSPHRPGVLYNGMIAPLIPYTIRGALWYQGESNSLRARQYRTLFPALIRCWRRAWGQGDFPFLFVQLANYTARLPDPGESLWAELREAQLLALSLPRTAMAVAADIGAADDIHPPNKQEVARRLALAAEALVHGGKSAYSGPLFRSMRVEGSRIRLRFEHVDGGLVAAGGGSLRGFAIAGPDRRFVWAEASIEGDSVVVWSAGVPGPVAVRYGWADNPELSLYNAAGLPASPFRTDDWPGLTDAAR